MLDLFFFLFVVLFLQTSIVRAMLFAAFVRNSALHLACNFVSRSIGWTHKTIHLNCFVSILPICTFANRFCRLVSFISISIGGRQSGRSFVFVRFDLRHAFSFFFFGLIFCYRTHSIQLNRLVISSYFSIYLFFALLLPNSFDCISFALCVFLHSEHFCGSIVDEIGRRRQNISTFFWCTFLE